MCGINGILTRTGALPDCGLRLVRAMNDSLAHRGPDDSGVWEAPCGTVFLGHRRLSIIDLSPGGHQPMMSDAGNVIVFNGEIFNYRELKRQLGRARFRSESDTEVLLKLYDAQGGGCLRHLTGMFAFAIWDADREELVIARDRVGKKPLYYVEMPGVFAFSSEVKALLTLPWVRAELDEIALYHFLTFNLVPDPRTMFKRIRKLPAAHTLRIGRSGRPSLERYWEVEYTDLSAASPEELWEELQSHLKRAVRQRLVSDVPVGVFLSGGVDSSGVVALIGEGNTARVKTYSVGFKDTGLFDERAHAARVAKRFGTDHREFLVTADDIREALGIVVDMFDEPVADPTCIPIHFLSRAARANGTIVVLTGDGSDEIFAGYRNWSKYRRLEPWYRAYVRLPGLAKRAALSVAAKTSAGSPVHEMLHRASTNQEFFWGGARSFKEGTKRDLLTDGYLRRVSHLTSYDVIREFRRAFETVAGHARRHQLTDWMCYLGVKFSIPNFYMYRADRLGMASSIEIRAPFLDHDLVSFALSIPAKHKVVNGEPKYILKKALEAQLDADILYRKKRGFNVPLASWGTDIMFAFVEAHLRRFCADYPFFRYDALRAEVAGMRAGRRHSVNRLWTIYFLMRWLQKWIRA